MIGPPTLAMWLRALRRRGVQCRLDDAGRVRVSGLRKLAPAERNALFDSALQLQQLLLQRAQRRRKDEEQQHAVASPPERPRGVVGMQVTPGYPSLSRLLHADELKEVDVRRARVLGTVPYGWKVGGQ